MAFTTRTGAKGLREDDGRGFFKADVITPWKVYYNEAYLNAQVKRLANRVLVHHPATMRSSAEAMIAVGPSVINLTESKTTISANNLSLLLATEIPSASEVVRVFTSQRLQLFPKIAEFGTVDNVVWSFRKTNDLCVYSTSTVVCGLLTSPSPSPSDPESHRSRGFQIGLHGVVGSVARAVLVLVVV